MTAKICLTAENLKNPELDKIRTEVVNLIQKMFDSGVWHTEALAEIYQLLEDYSDAKAESYKKQLVEEIEKERFEDAITITTTRYNQGLSKAIEIIKKEQS